MPDSCRAAQKGRSRGLPFVGCFNSRTGEQSVPSPCIKSEKLLFSREGKDGKHNDNFAIETEVRKFG